MVARVLPPPTRSRMPRAPLPTAITARAAAACRRASPMSARAPLNGLNASSGRYWTKVTSPTRNADEVSEYMRIAEVMLKTQTPVAQSILPPK